MSIRELIEKAPKAELHVHIEGTMEPELLFRLSARNNIALPYTLEESLQSRLSFTDLQDFLREYYDGCRVLITSEDFYELAKSYFEKAIKSNILHCEVFFDPGTHTNRGISFETIISGLTRASEEVRDRINAHWIMCFLRDHSEEEALEILKIAEPYSHLIKGIGLDSNEIENPPKKFENAYKIASAKGFCGDGSFKVAHAGEECDATSAISALYYLGIKRIDHGIRSLDSPFLCKFLRDSKIPLTVCPLSNDKLQVVSRFFNGRKLIKELYDLGIVVTINSDDPAFFGGYINENYESALLDFEDDQKKEVLIQFCKNGFKASFISDEEKEKYCQLVDKALA